jgi:hypothetical protein
MEDYVGHIFEFKAQQNRTLREFVPGTLRNKVVMEPVMMAGVCESIDPDGPRLVLRVDVETEDPAVKIPKAVWKVRPDAAKRTDFVTPPDTEQIENEARLAELLAAESSEVADLVPLLLDLEVTPANLASFDVSDEALDRAGVPPECCDGLRRVVAEARVRADAAATAAAADDLTNLDGRLLAAATKGDEKEVQWLLDRGANPNHDDCREQTPLHKAAQFGWPIVATRLLEMGAFVNIEDSQTRTALHLACINGHGEVTRVLLDGGAIANSTDRFMKKPVFYAAQRTALGCLDALRMHGANVDEALASLAAHKKRVQLLPGDSQPDDEWDWEGGGGDSAW